MKNLNLNAITTRSLNISSILIERFTSFSQIFKELSRTNKLDKREH